jgi:hypothetical protein
MLQRAQPRVVPCSQSFVLLGGLSLLRRRKSRPTPRSLGRRTPLGWLGASFSESCFLFFGGRFAMPLSFSSAFVELQASCHVRTR